MALLMTNGYLQGIILEQGDLSQSFTKGIQRLLNVGLGPNGISNLARKLGLVVYLMNSSVSVDTILVNRCYLFNGLQKK